MLKNLQYYRSALSFLRLHYSIMLSFFINFSLSLFHALSFFSLSSSSSSPLSPSPLFNPNTVPPPSDYPLIFALSSYPHATADLVLSIHSFLLFLSFSLRLFVSISLCISSSWVLGVAGMQCWVWLGCGGVSWIVDLYGGSWWVFAISPQNPKGSKA